MKKGHACMSAYLISDITGHWRTTSKVWCRFFIHISLT